MTLNTSVAIGSPCEVDEVYAFCRALLGTPEDVEPQRGHKEGDFPRWLDQAWIANPMGIGLPALLWIYYSVDSPMTHQCDKWCPDEAAGAEEKHEHEREIADDPLENGWAWINVTFDTTYSYRGAGGETCSGLHARLVAALGRWLDDKGVPWKWRNEYTGEWFDRYDQLAEFGGAHESTGADDWFRNTVIPAIVAHTKGGS